jgi:cell division protein FtsB
MPSASAAREELLRGLKLDARTITMAGILILAIVSIAPQMQVLITQQQAIADMRAQVEQAKQDVKDMSVERKRWEDPVYIRAQARDRLYYVMPGEVSYLVMDANGVDQSDTSGTVGAMIAARNNNAQISSSVHTTKNNWVDALVETVVRSGIEEPVAKKAAN